MKRYHPLSASVILTIPFWSPSNAVLDQGFNVTRESWLFNGTLEPDTAAQLPEACVTAYTKPIDCNATILMSPNVDAKKSTLEDACQPECATSMLTYERAVREACAGADLKALGLGQSWLDSVISGQASLLLYWKQCLREMFVTLLLLLLLLHEDNPFPLTKLQRNGKDLQHLAIRLRTSLGSRHR